MLQAMTAPENCAVTPTENIENYSPDPSPYANWPYDPNYAPPYWPYPPYWGYYDPNMYAQGADPPNSSSSPNPTSKSKSAEHISGDQTPGERKGDAEKHNGGAETPSSITNEINYQYYPYWDPYNGYQEQSDGESTPAPTENGVSRSQCTTPAFWDPYGYAYYYGYPPMYSYPPYSPYFFYQNASDPEDVAGYSSNDEMSYYGAKFAQKAQRNGDKVEVETPSIIVTPTPTPNRNGECQSRDTESKVIKVEKGNKKYLDVDSDSDSDDTEVEDDEAQPKSPRVSNSSSLQSIPSVSNIQVYDSNDKEAEIEVDTEAESEYEEAEDNEVAEEVEEVEECEIEEPESEETSEDTPDADDDDVSIYISNDGIVPHQLSIIYEESERGSLAGSKCEHSMSQTSLDTVVSGGGSTSTIENAEESDDEDADPASSTVTVRLPLKLKFSVSDNDEAVTTVTVGDSEVNTLKLPSEVAEADVHTRVTLKSPSRTPTRGFSPFVGEDDEENVTVTVNVRSRSSSAIRVLAEAEDDVSVDENPLARTFSTDNYDTADSDAEVSISVSIPLSSKKKTQVAAHESSEESDKGVEIKKAPAAAGGLVNRLLPHTINNKNEDVSVWVSLNKERSVEKEVEDMDWCGSIKTMESEANKHQSDEEYELEDDEDEEEVEEAEEVEEVEDEESADEEKEVIQVAAQKKEAIAIKNNQDISDDESESSESSSASSSDSSSSSRKDRRESARKSSVKEKKSDSTIVEEKSVIKEENKVKIIKESSVGDVNNNAKSDSSESVFEKAENKVDLMSIKERIQALQKASKSSYKPKANDNSKMSVKDRVSMIEEIGLLAKEIEETEVITGTTTVAETTSQKSTKGSIKSSEECSEEEEADSGVTSDMSRHISETDTEPDCFPELRKMTRYQRAATHSRLFKLLQDECGDDDDEEEEQVRCAEASKKEHNVSVTRRKANNESAGEEKEATKPNSDAESMLIRREHLSLPLKTNPSGSDSFSSSGITSPGSPTVNEKLVAELVQSMLKRKKGRIYRNIPLEKLHAAALRILQEDMDRGDTVSSSSDGGSTHISPLRPDTVTSTPAQTPQEFYGNNNYHDYCTLYESWNNDATELYDARYDILPSRAFKILQEHAMGENKAGAINGLSAKCPRVLSSRSFHKQRSDSLSDPTHVPKCDSSAPKEAKAS